MWMRWQTMVLLYIGIDLGLCVLRDCCSVGSSRGRGVRGVVTIPSRIILSCLSNDRTNVWVGRDALLGIQTLGRLSARKKLVGIYSCLGEKSQRKLVALKDSPRAWLAMRVLGLNVGLMVLEKRVEVLVGLVLNIGLLVVVMLLHRCVVYMALYQTSSSRVTAPLGLRRSQHRERL